MTHRSPRALTRRLALALSLMMVVSVLALPAIAEDDTSGRSFTASVAPDEVCNGVEETFTLTLTNTSSQQRLGSARVDVPGEVTDLQLNRDEAGDPVVVVSQQRGPKTDPIVSYDADIGVISLDDLSAAPRATVKISFTATATGDAGTSPEFTTRAKQANDFNSTNDTANELVLVGDQPSTTIVSCGTLKFDVQPGDTSVRVAVPGADGSAGPKVAIVDGTGEVIKSASASITIALTPDETAAGVLSGTRTKATVGGIATFDDLTIDEAGTYTLTASAAGYLDVDSESFEVFAFGDTCEAGQQCSTTLEGNNGSTSLSGTADGSTGALIGNSVPNDGNEVGICGAVDRDDTPVDYEIDDYSYLPNQVTIGGTNLTDKLVEFRVSKRFDQLQENNGVAFYQVCATRLAPFNQSSTFVDIFGNVVVSPDDTRALGELGFLDEDGNIKEDAEFQTSGFLPDCTSADDSPCVESRVKRGGGPVITVRWGSRWRMR